MPPALEPMQIDSYHLSQSERQRRINNNLFLYCGAEGHLISNCPICPACPAVSTIQLPPIISSSQKLQYKWLPLVVTLQLRPSLTQTQEAISSRENSSNVSTKEIPSITGFKYPHNPGKASGTKSDNPLHTHSHSKCWHITSRSDFLSSFVGLNSWHHPGTPMDADPLKSTGRQGWLTWSPHRFKNCLQLPQPTGTAIAVFSMTIKSPYQNPNQRFP